MTPATNLTAKQISDELDALDTQFRDFRNGDCEHGGSPGEWMVERMDELETELRRRRAAGTAT